MYPPIETVRKYLQYLEAADSEGDAELVAGRIRLLRIRGDAAQLELNRAKGLVARQLKSQVDNIVILCRTELLHIAGRLAPRLAAETQAQHCFSLVDGAIREALNRLADSADAEIDEATGLPLSFLERDDDEADQNSRTGGNSQNGAKGNAGATPALATKTDA